MASRGKAKRKLSNQDPLTQEPSTQRPHEPIMHMNYANTVVDWVARKNIRDSLQSLIIYQIFARIALTPKEVRVFIKLNYIAPEDQNVYWIAQAIAHKLDSSRSRVLAEVVTMTTHEEAMILLLQKVMIVKGPGAERTVEWIRGTMEGREPGLSAKYAEPEYDASTDNAQDGDAEMKPWE
ncbi:hypothetical protein GQ44DRAFT_710338 [Phaeosphaeriaceae sp. PMI808]|nr:hypothetical protein GQ44DRAFT_710338 [Phaeosphaeriaceae sp. PMI808]